ncbi:D-aminoacylase, partial [candidate division KSB1 bacterium]|nr:D-aminoacylase [candidate division KSB1 bacterium]
MRDELAAGALGLSSGLEYDPGIYATTEEVIALARETARAGGRYISHIRSEDRSLWDAVEEIIHIGRDADLPVQISHVKLAMRSLWGQADRLLARLDEARAAGVEITADVYPYTYWQSTKTVLFPERD